MMGDEVIQINGVDCRGSSLIQIIEAITHPNPDIWYRFEREGNLVTVHTMRQQDISK